MGLATLQKRRFDFALNRSVSSPQTVSSSQKKIFQTGQQQGRNGSGHFPPLYTGTQFPCFIAEASWVWSMDSDCKSAEEVALYMFTQINPFCRSQAVIKDCAGPGLCLQPFAGRSHAVESNCCKMLLHNVSDKVWRRQRRVSSLCFSPASHGIQMRPPQKLYKGTEPRWSHVFSVTLRFFCRFVFPMKKIKSKLVQKTQWRLKAFYQPSCRPNIQWNCI